MRTARIMTVLVLTVGRHTAGFAYGGYFEVTPVDRAYRDAGMVYAKLDSLDEADSQAVRDAAALRAR
jgi:hypothetical protein